MKKNYFLKVLLITLIGLGTNAYGQTATWDGSSNDNWFVAANWTGDFPEEDYTGNIIIPLIPGGTYPTIQSDVDLAGDLTIESGATLTLTNDGSFNQQSGDLTLAGQITIDSGSELLIKSSVTVLVSSGTIVYKRYLDHDWHLIASPVTEQDIDDFVANEGIASGTGSNQGFATYDIPNNAWDFYQSGDTGTGNFVSGQGYSIKLATPDSDIQFSGKLVAVNKTIALTRGSTDNRSYNLIGNPYTSHIKSANILTRSTSALVNRTIYLWDSANTQYVTKVNDDAYRVGPGQSFFVRALNTGNLVINRTDQATAATDNFLRTDPRPEIHITLSNGSLSRQAKIYYRAGTTTGFDNGFDGPMFQGGDNSFAFYSHLVSDSEGVEMAIQSLPLDNYENMIVPIGVNAVSGSNISIDVSTIEFPEGINIYLEDKENNSFTLLDSDSDFSTTLDSDLNGIGRFYLHTTSGVLSSDDLLINKNISIYSNSRENLRIVGVQNGTANIHIYNILGKEVFRSVFEGSGMNDIQLPNLTEGIYIINLTTDNGTINKKVIIQ